MVRIRRFSVIRTSNVVALMYFVLFAIILVPILVLAGAAGQQVNQPGTEVVRDLGPIGFGLLGLLAALVYAVLAWIITALTCLLYNFVARFTGGVEVQVERFERPAPTPVATWGPQQPPAPGR